MNLGNNQSSTNQPSSDDKNYHQQLWVVFGVFIVSLFLPALIWTDTRPSGGLILSPQTKSNIVAYGYQAFTQSLAAVLVVPFGPILAMTTPLSVITFIGIYRQKSWAILSSISLFGLMLAWPIFLPNRPDGELITMPGGQMGIGYYFWLICGLWLLVIAHVQYSSRKLLHPDLSIPYKKTPRFFYVLVCVFLALLIFFQVFVLNYALPFSKDLYYK